MCRYAESSPRAACVLRWKNKGSANAATIPSVTRRNIHRYAHIAHTQQLFCSRVVHILLNAWWFIYLWDAVSPRRSRMTVSTARLGSVKWNRNGKTAKGGDQLELFDTPLLFEASIAIPGVTILACCRRPADFGRVVLWGITVLLEMEVFTLWAFRLPPEASSWSDMEFGFWYLDTNWCVVYLVPCLAVVLWGFVQATKHTRIGDVISLGEFRGRLHFVIWQRDLLVLMFLLAIGLAYLRWSLRSPELAAKFLAELAGTMQSFVSFVRKNEGNEAVKLMLLTSIDASQLFAILAVRRSSMGRMRQLVAITAMAVVFSEVNWCWDTFESGLTIATVWRFGDDIAHRITFAAVSTVSLHLLLPPRARYECGAETAAQCP